MGLGGWMLDFLGKGGEGLGDERMNGRGGIRYTGLDGWDDWTIVGAGMAVYVACFCFVSYRYGGVTWMGRGALGGMAFDPERPSTTKYDLISGKRRDLYRPTILFSAVHTRKRPHPSSPAPPQLRRVDSPDYAVRRRRRQIMWGPPSSATTPVKAKKQNQGKEQIAVKESIFVPIHGPISHQFLFLSQSSDQVGFTSSPPPLKRIRKPPESRKTVRRKKKGA